jgi:FkbM family methyltransferase
MIIDVGANKGEFALEVAKRNPNINIIAIEPVPQLVSEITNIIKLDNIKNIQILKYAIDINERKDFLNVSMHHDWGVSSLLNFDESKITTDDYWKTRTDMYFDAKIDVEVKRLETILDEQELVENIEFIKIDAQGLDLQVLQSAGKYLKIINAGMLEISINTSLGLYENEEFGLLEVLTWLDENGFISYALKPNDPASNEYNL